MSDFKKCANGHYYQNSEASCPYCPKPGSADFGNAATVAGSADKTQVYQAPGQAASYNPMKTQVIGAPPAGAQPFAGGMGAGPVASRKLMGWIVTYDGNPNGADFRIYEGRNTLGYGKENDIVIDFDVSVSTKHLTIRYHQMDGFAFKDEMSTNGTFLNGKFSNEGKLADGDRIKTGNVTFLFRTANI